jgi:hypothetical protein
MMPKEINLLVNTGISEIDKQYTVLVAPGSKANPVVIKAIKGARYELQDVQAQNAAPQRISALIKIFPK